MSFLERVTDALESAAYRVSELDGRYLLPALALQLAGLAFRALAWRGVLAAAYPGRRIPVVSVGAAYAAGVGLNAFLPARGGEAVKVLLVRARIPGSTVTTIAASLTVILLLDAVLGASLVVLLWSLGVLPALPALPGLPGVGTAPLVLGATAAAVAAAVVATRLRPGLVRRLVAHLAQGVAVLRSPGRYALTVVPFQLGAWACRIGVVALVLAAFGIEAGLGTAALVVVLNGASTAVPVPGGAGTQQVLATYALQGVVSTAAAVSFSLGMQVGVTVVNTTVGLVALMLLFRTLRPVAALRTARAFPPGR